MQQPGAKEDYCIEGDSGEVTETLGLICFILNIIAPGLGTIIAAIAGSKGCNCKGVIIGCVQSLLVLVLVGWIWSILHGYHIWLRSKGKQ